MWDTHARRQALREAARNPALTHIVREVYFTNFYKTGNKSEEELCALVDRTKGEHDLLRSPDLQIAPTDWFVLPLSKSPITLLARVAIIDGEDLSHPNMHEHLLAARTAVRAYMFSEAKGVRLGDLDSPEQYVRGKVRGADCEEEETYLVDIEPLYYSLAA
jgi:hypothetical protein